MDLMIDLETLSSRYDAAILQIGAIKFNPHGDDRDMLEAVLKGEQDPDSSLFFEMPVVPNGEAHIDPETVTWWLRQKKEAQEAVANAVCDEATALQLFTNWIGDTRGMKVWAKSPSADLVWLDNAYKRMARGYPWDFKSERDVRTIQTIAREITGKSIPNWKPEGLATHNAIVDCALQVYQVQQSYRMLMK